MKATKVIIVAVVILIAAILIVGLIAPKEYEVTRSTTIDASADEVFENVYYFKNFDRWSPWYDMDTTQQTTIEGNDGEVGSKMSWKSENEQVGEGYLERKSVEKNKSIVNELGFDDGRFLSTDSWTFVEEDGRTTVTWTNSSNDLNFVAGMFFMFNDPDKMMGKDFEKGLEKLKAYVESHPKKSEPKEMVIELTQYGASNVISIKEKTTRGNLEATLGKLYGELSAYVSENNLETQGMPFAIWHLFDPPNIEVEAGFSTVELAKGNDRIKAYESNLGEVAVGHYYGPYTGFEQAHAKMHEWVKANGKEVAGPPVEVYQTDPGAEPDQNKWLTDIIYPVK